MAKSTEVKLNEALTKLKASSTAKYEETWKKMHEDGVHLNIDKQLALVEAALLTVKESNPLDPNNISEALRDPHVAVLFGVEPRQKATTTTNKEHATPIRMNNGRSENFVENNPFNDGRGNTVTETNNTRKDIFAKGDKVLREALGIPEVKPSAEYEKLTEGQKKEFDFARAIGISESDAFTVVKITGGYKQVSRR